FTIYPRPDALYLEAMHLTLSNDYEGAIRDYQEIAKLDPSRPEAHLDLGRAYERNNMTEKAISSYTTATSLNNSYAAAFLRLGTLHARLVNQPGATAAFDRAQRLYADRGNKEGEAAVRYQRGRLFLGLKKEPEARGEFTQALQLARDTNNVYQQVQSLLQLAPIEETGEQARQTADEAIRLAQSSGMNDQLANGYITMGIVLFKQEDLSGAEDYFKQALGYATTYKLKRYEALAYLNLASLSQKQGKVEEAGQFLEKAHDFFVEGGYRREADQQTIVAARSKRDRGDFDGALKLLEEQLSIPEQMADPAQVATLHHECGTVLKTQEKYAQALLHFEQSVPAFRSLNIQSLLPYSQVSMARSLFALGRYEEAEKILNEVADADPQTLSGGRKMVATAHLHFADLELSQQRYPEAAARAKEAIRVLKEGNVQADYLFAWANADLGMVESFGGAHDRAKALCNDAVRLASLAHDNWVTTHAYYALAVALLGAGDADGARAAAEQVLNIVTRQGGADTQWRALALGGMACRLAGNQDAMRDYFSRAATTLAQFEQSLGADAVGYRSRPDIQRLRGEIGASVASVAR
ncbi:MAG: tetratricopeptide repeat protein, partial [Pyrinomonadaceae bacterium]